MIRIITVSDLHFGQRRKRDKEIKSKLEKMRKKYFTKNDTYLLVAGDITENGSQDEYETAATALGRFGDKVIICPGNHDYGKKGNLYDSACAKNFDKLVNALAVQESNFFSKKSPVVTELIDPSGETKVVLIGINSCSKTKSVSDLACGEVEKKQLRNLVKILKKYEKSDFYKMVYLHHHPCLHPDVSALVLRLFDAELFLAVLAGKADVLAFGHKHEQAVCEDAEEFVNIPHVVANGKFVDDKNTFSFKFDSSGVTKDFIPIEAKTSMKKH